VVGTLINGQWFGETQLVDDTMQPVTVRAQQRCTLLTIDKQRFDQFVAETPSMSSVVENIDCVSHKKTRVTLRSLPFFAQVSEIKLQKLAALIEFKRFKDKEDIVVEGDPGDGFFVIIKGSCDVYCQLPPDKKSVKIMELPAGE
jgi:CRP-like cAMP-binding protein